MTDAYTLDPELEELLHDLGPMLDTEPTTSIAAAVLERVDELDRRPTDITFPERRWRLLVAAAVAVLVTLAALIAFEPTRAAIANWLGIGAVQITRVEGTTPPNVTASLPGSDASARPPYEQELRDVRARVSFPIRLPDASMSGRPSSIAADPAVPGGLVSIMYDRFALTEIATSSTQAPVIQKLLPANTTLEFVKVDGHDGAWVGGAPHELGFVGTDGSFRMDTVRRAGNVLIWVDGGVTYRIEGLDSKDEALRIAASMR